MVQRVGPNDVVLAVGPVDVRVSVPARTTSALVPGDEIALRTYLYVREDQLALYGFHTGDELALFELLMTVSGIGPKAALAILSVLEANEVRRAINLGNAQPFTRAPGVGARAAARIVTDLRGKVGAVEAEAEAVSDVEVAALGALMAMGYSSGEAKRAVENAGARDTVEDLLRSALGILADR
ncbi:MAG TPA: Holliday junction branch migration protein RuvA [Chloroflexota bacterium]|nr:Holliday junction branch migration protein RuvA [Chloroflexota bacterium]